MIFKSPYNVRTSIIPEDTFSWGGYILKSDQEITQRDCVPYGLCGVVVELTESGARMPGF